MAKRKTKRTRIPKGAKGLNIKPGRCKNIEGSTTVCVSKSGDVSIKPGKTYRAKRRSKAVKLETGKKLIPSKYAPTPKEARKIPKGPTTAVRRLVACRSNLFTNAKTGNCSCVTVNSKGNLQVTPLSSEKCPYASRYDAARAKKLVRQGKLKRPEKFFYPKKGGGSWTVTAK